MNSLQNSLNLTMLDNTIMTTSMNQDLFSMLDTFTLPTTQDLVTTDTTDNTDTTNKTCCSNKTLITYRGYSTCTSCGKSDKVIDTTGDSSWENQEGHGPAVNPLLPKTSTATILSYLPGKQAADNTRLHHWLSYDYREGQIKGCYQTIDNLIIKLGIYSNISINNKAKLIYNNIYIGDNDTSRGSVKKSIIVFSILCALDDLDIEYNILDVLRVTNISIEHYNFGISKIEEREKVYLHENIEEFRALANRYTQLDDKVVIDIYNINLKKKEENKFCINNKTLLIASIYMLIENKLNKKTFCKEFSITNTTLNKALRVLNPEKTKKKKTRRVRPKYKQAKQ